jgi:hypothetical protein
MFYVKWFAQVMLIMVLVSIVALLVPSPPIAAVMLIVTIVWSLSLLGRLVRYLVFPSTPTPDSPGIEPSADFGLGAQVALPDRVTTATGVVGRPPVAQRVVAGNVAGPQRTCSRINARVRRASRGRSSSASFIYCRARRPLPAA